jgi:hypothetical protein
MDRVSSLATKLTLTLIVSPDFTDAITGDWGGRPFDDLIAGWKYVLDAFPEVNMISSSGLFV